MKQRRVYCCRVNSADGSFSLDSGEALQVFPLLGLVEPIHGVECPAAAHLSPSMPLIGRIARGTWNELAADACLGKQEGFDEFGVVVFHAQQ